jgi:hypothetical protein
MCVEEFDWGNYKPKSTLLKWETGKRWKTCLDRCCPCGKAPHFWSMNWAAALMHLLNTVVTFIFWATDQENKDNVFKLSEEYAPWVPTLNSTEECPPTPNRIIKISDEWCIERKTKLTSELSLWWLVIAFHFLSFAFQAFAFFEWKCNCCQKCGERQCVRKNYRLEVEESGTNVLRMIEYSISATLMQISIALVLGIWQQLVIIGIAMLTVVTMLLGLIAELSKNDNMEVAWIAHFSGWLSMLGVWGIIGRQFQFTIQESTNAPPVFVYIIVIAIAALYSSFGLVQLVQLALQMQNGQNPETNAAVELAYTTLSLVSKTFLGWIIFANALTGMAIS